MGKPHQRIGSKSNAHVGREFELSAKAYFEKQGIELALNVKIPIGIDKIKKEHAFDLGSNKELILVECKPHK